MFELESDMDAEDTVEEEHQDVSLQPVINFVILTLVSYVSFSW